MKLSHGLGNFFIVWINLMMIKRIRYKEQQWIKGA